MTDFINNVKSCLCRLHGVSSIDLIETHISWVLLTGTTVYKIKKPVDLGFVNFTTQEKRRHFCFEELRLNKRLAPSLYIDVVTITGDDSSVEINGRQTAIDYAVRLHQFDRRQPSAFEQAQRLRCRHVAKIVVRHCSGPRL